MADVITKPKQQNRICYVEPNDVFGNIDGQPITPPYEDFCISFDLIVKTFSRFKTTTESGTATVDDNVKYKISWTSKANDGTPSWVTFLQGSKVGRTSDSTEGVIKKENTVVYDPYEVQSLSTSYTDISFNQYFKGEVVEGLGVEQVQVSFESWMCPTVVIKFVDVRGAALFGREEAIHYDGKITADNVFGCFFTFPYPEFKLQIKGFLGKPVTFQLTCANFKGELNSQNGNFEATATFIGYQYSLLTDIPFEYLVAAPNNPYIGVSYWNKHKSDATWAMLGKDGKRAGEPVKLDYFFQSINNAQKEYNEECQSLSSSANEDLSAINNEKTLLNNILETFNNFYKALRTDIGENLIDVTDNSEGQDPKRQIVLFSKSENIKLVTATNMYKSYLEAITTYNDAFQEKVLDSSCYPNGWETACPLDITATDFFDISVGTDKNYNGIKVKLLNGQEATTTNVMNLTVNDKKLSQETAKTICHGLQKPYNTKFLQYAYVIEVGNFINEITTNIEALNNNEKKLQKEVKQSIDDKIEKILPLLPYVGNVFKLIFCHLETFCHIMYEAAKEIQSETTNGMRKPAYLGISMEKTDISNTKVIGDVPPWPGVFNSGAVTEDGGDVDDSVEVFGWVGDFSNNFIEEQVVRGFKKGIQTIEDKKANMEDNGKTIVDFPITPMDMNLDGSVFNGMKDPSLSDLSGYLAIRAAQIFGIQDTNADANMASIVGKIDSLNYYRSIGSVGDIEGKIFNVLGGANVVDVMSGIAKCDVTYDSYGVTSSGSEKTRHKFETVGKITDDSEGRHPMFKDNKWVHYYTEKGTGLVPAKFDDYANYKNFISYNSNNGKPYFKSETDYNGATNVEEAKYQLYKIDWITTTKNQTYKNYNKNYNKYMFNIYTNSSEVDSLMEQYNQMKEGNVKVLNYEMDDKDTLTKFIDRYWKVGNDTYKDFFKGQYTLCANIATRGLDTKKLFNSDNYYGFEDEKITPDFTGWSDWYQMVCQDDLTWKNSKGVQCNIGDMVVASCQIYNDEAKDYLSNATTLFGSPFYYAQEKISNEETKNKVKALLYLHTLQYDFSKILNVFKNGKTNGCIESVPYGYLLLLGGLLWRTHQSTEPILFSGNGKESGNGKKYLTPSGLSTTLFHKQDGRYYFMITGANSGKANPYNVSLANLLGGNDSISWNIECQLIDLFENFCKNEFPTIKNGCEISNFIIGSKPKEYSPSDIIEDAKEYYKRWAVYKTNSDGSPITNKRRMVWMRNGFADLMGNGIMKYRMVAVKNHSGDYGMLMFLNEDNTAVQNAMKDVYTRKCLISDCNGIRLARGATTNATIIVNDNIFKSYLKGFTDSLSDIIKKGEVKVSDDSSDDDSEDSKKTERDLLTGMYYFLKNVWDKWLSDRSENTYDVAEFFDPNFIFIDSYYRNTYFKLPINCSYLIKEYGEMANNKSLYAFIGDLTKDHQCWFAAVPDFIHFKGADDETNNMSADIDTMKDVFRPMPYNSMPKAENSNKFVIIYTFKPSEVPSDVNFFKYDGFDIWSHTDGFDVAPKVFKSDRLYEQSGDEITRLGYMVPSFGVSFARQNQHLFKNIRVSMNNPTQTEHSIANLHNVISVGKSGERKVSFVGQDVYNIYSNYSYECEVEMMGDAQIVPLMYFQLLNVPMWKGTYMIYKVTHNMVAGNMTTTFTGMKMCKYPKPFGTSFFVRADDGDTRDNSFFSNDGYVSSDANYDGYISSNMETKKTNRYSQDYYRDKNTGNYKTVSGGGIDKYGSVTANSKLKDLFNCVYEEIANLPENKNGMTWNITLSHVIRVGSGKSAHYKGNAMDLSVAYYKNGKPYRATTSGETQRELTKVANIIASFHLNEIDQMILEYNSGSDMTNPSKMNNFNVLHVGVLSNDGKRRQQVFMTPDSTYRITNGFKGGDWLKNVHPDFKQIAKRAYYADKNNFTQKFINYQGCSNDTLDEHFGVQDTYSSSDISNSEAFEKWVKWTGQIEGTKSVTLAPQGYGIEPNSWSVYHSKSGSNSNNPKNYLKWVWKGGNGAKCESLDDGNVAVIYARGNFFIPGKINDNTIGVSTLNGKTGVKAFNTILKKIGDYMLSKEKINSHGGWRKFLYYTEYGKFPDINNQADVTVAQVQNKLNSLEV